MVKYKTGCRYFIQTCERYTQRKDGKIPKAPLGDPPVVNEILIKRMAMK